MLIISWSLLALISLISMLISQLIVIRGTHPLESILIGVLIGAVIRNLDFLPSKWEPYLKKFETPLLWGIILLGSGFTLEIAKAESFSLIVILVTMSVGFFFVFFLGKVMGLSLKLSILLGVGTTICGGTAIAISAPLIEAEKEEVSYAVTTIVIAAFFLLLGLPYLGKLFDMSQVSFGVWAGTSVHNTPQTIGTGYAYGEISGQVATMVKLTRNMFMVLVAVLMAFWYRSKGAAKRRLEKKEILKAFPWFLFGYLGMALLRFFGFFTPQGVSYFNSAAKFLILMGMVGIGFGTDFRAIIKLGYKPLLVGILGAAAITLVSFVMVVFVKG